MPKRKTIDELFKGRHFEDEIIILCVHWYLRYKLSSRDLVEMMAERGLVMSHTTILRWAQRFVPEFEKRWNRYAAGVSSTWRVDETYVKIKRPMGLFVPGRGSRGQDGGLSVEPAPQCRRRQGISA